MVCSHVWVPLFSKEQRKELRKMLSQETFVCDKDCCPFVKLVNYKEDGSVLSTKIVSQYADDFPGGPIKPLYGV